MEKEICYQSLSKTFQEAVAVTKSLGVRYLWIDSLCIIQDSIIDWQQEGLKMSHVYSNSYLNIAAAHATDGRGGLFTTRNPDKMQPIYIDTDWNGIGKYRLFLRDEAFWNRGVDQAPLHQRGWVLQERALAKRTVHFGSDQLFWECCEGTYSETFPQGPVFGSFFGHSGRIYLPYLERNKADADRAWRTTLEVYSRCTITQAGDKLVAVAGIAQHLQAITGHEYVAGLWSENMLDNLVWYVLSPRGTERPRSYRAPSWSWAALDAEILPQLQIFQRREASIRDWHVKTVLESPFSQITDAYLRLRWTRLYAATLKCDERGICSTKLHNKIESRTSDYTDSQVIAEDMGNKNLYPDILPPLGAFDVFFLPLGQDYYSTYMISLVLIPVRGENSGVYKRFGVHEAKSVSIIGLLNDENKENESRWYEDATDWTIRII